jgi:hypothetical protein
MLYGEVSFVCVILLKPAEYPMPTCGGWKFASLVSMRAGSSASVGVLGPGVVRPFAGERSEAIHLRSACHDEVACFCVILLRTRARTSRLCRARGDPCRQLIDLFAKHLQGSTSNCADELHAA